MHRWGEWGDGSRDVPLPSRLPALLAGEVGVGVPPFDVPLDDVVAATRTSRLAGTSPPVAWALDPLDRLLHARGQSFPDLVAVRSGDVGPVPDAVARPGAAAEVRALLSWAAAHDAVVVPWGGGTSVVGGVDCPTGERPVVVADLVGLSGVRDVDRVSSLATVGAGATGPACEAGLREHGLVLGHRPQSFEHSTVGGWVATRSSGQQSLGFGRIEDLFAGGTVESPVGPLTLPPFPASAAGPDLRHAVLGSEGRLGVLVEAVLRVRPLPEVDDVVACYLPGWDEGVAAVRALAADPTGTAGLSMLRLSTPAETAVSFALAGAAGRALQQGLRLARLGGAPCLLLAGVTGDATTARRVRARVRDAVRRHAGRVVGTRLGRRWQRSRYDSPYWRSRLWELGYGVDTVETAAVWSAVPALVADLERSVAEAVAATGARAHVGTHLSHVYRTGSSVYTTAVFPLGASREATLERWRALKSASLAAIARSGGTVSHQHGVGRDHRAAAVEEKGPVGTAALGALVDAFDPDGVLATGNLLPGPPAT
ncbi:FAD-binding oxidoreductase [Aquipuribacter nitratireducens]|uniref:FAD-binding oxidoreductase n=1 Tax=Aquipuribacter nitratireducens TaxID=650104 RepID=A0ABW0GQ77_9MICO